MIMFDLFRYGRQTFRNRLLALALVGAMLPQASTSAQFTLVAETSGPVPSTNLTFGSFGVPSLNYSGIIGTGKWNLAVDHSGGVSLGNGILSYTDSGANFTFYADPVGMDLDRPSAQGVFAQEPAFAVGSPGGFSAVRSGNVTLPATTPSGGSILFNGRPSAGVGNIIYMATTAPLGVISWEIISHDVVNNVRTRVLDGNNGVIDFAGLSAPSGGFSDLSYGGNNLVLRGHGNPSVPQSNGIFRMLVQRTPGSLFVAFGPLETIVTDGAPIPDGLGSFLPSTNFAFSSSSTTETLPVAYGSVGAAWSYTSLSSGSGVFTGTPTGGVVRVSPPGASGTYGDVSAAGGGGLLMYERPSLVGNQIYMNLMGKETLVVDRTMIPRRPVTGFVSDVDMGSQALIQNPFPFSGNSPYGSTLTFFASGFFPHPIDAIYVTNVPQVGINLGGDFDGSILSDPGDINFFKVVPCTDPTVCITLPNDPPLSDYLEMVGRNSFGDEFGLTQEIGNGLGVDSGGSDDPFMINDNAGIAEGVSISLDYEVNFDTILFRNLDPGESVMIGVDGAMTEFFYTEEGQEQLMGGLQAIELNSLFLPAGSILNIEYGSGDGFTLESVILQSALIPSLEGDFDLNGGVDGGDFLAWQRGESPDPLSLSDLAAWESSYGNNAPLVGAASSTAVPEPTTVILLLVGMTSLLIRHRMTEPNFNG